MTLGSKLRRRRLEIAKSQTQLANEAGVGASYLSRVENGRIVPSTRTLIKLAGALDVHVAWFFDGDGSQSESCPVSLSGDCILNMPRAIMGRAADPAVESYDQRQLDILRGVNKLLHTGSLEVRKALACAVKGMMQVCHDADLEDQEAAVS